MNDHDDLERTLARWFDADAVEPAPADRFQQAIAATGEHRPRPAMLAGFGSAWVQPGSVAGAPRFSLDHGRSPRHAHPGARRRCPHRRRTAASDPCCRPRRQRSHRLRVGRRHLCRRSCDTARPGPSCPGRSATRGRSSRRMERGSLSCAAIRGPRTRSSSWFASTAPTNGSSCDGLSANAASSFTWIPDRASLVVNHDSRPFTTPYFDGELSLLDATGVDEPRLLTPPLPVGVGGPYFRYTDQVAPMFRPPSGDLILSSATGPASAAAAGSLEGLYAWDADLVESHPARDRRPREVPAVLLPTVGPVVVPGWIDDRFRTRVGRSRTVRDRDLRNACRRYRCATPGGRGRRGRLVAGRIEDRLSARLPPIQVDRAAVVVVHRPGVRR